MSIATVNVRVSVAPHFHARLDRQNRAICIETNLRDPIAISTTSGEEVPACHEVKELGAFQLLNGWILITPN
jgi:hypothetical protein